MFNMKKIVNRLYPAFAVLIVLGFVAVFIGLGQFRAMRGCGFVVVADEARKS